MDLRKHIDEYKTLAERVEQTIAHKRDIQDSFENVGDFTLVRIFSGEINIYENMLREIKATISLLEDMKGANNHDD